MGMPRGKEIVVLLNAKKYNPVTALGTDLLAWWDADQQYWGANGGMTIATGVSAWADIVGSYAAAQATGSLQPVFSSTSFGGGPGVTFDGADDNLAFSISGQFPAGATGGEIWLLAEQDALAADATTRSAVEYGSGTGNAQRGIRRIVATGANFGRVITGDGASIFGANQNNGVFSTRHVVRDQISPTTTTITVDGTDSNAVSVVPGTTATRLRLGANSANTAANFWQGPIAAALLTNPLAAARANALQTWLLSRRRL